MAGAGVNKNSCNVLELPLAQCLKRSQRPERRKCSQEISSMCCAVTDAVLRSSPCTFYNGRGIVIDARGHKQPLRFFAKKGNFTIGFAK